MICHILEKGVIDDDDRYTDFFAKREEHRLALLKEVQEEMQPEMVKKARL